MLNSRGLPMDIADKPISDNERAQAQMMRDGCRAEKSTKVTDHSQEARNTRSGSVGSAPDMYAVTKNSYR